MSEYIVRETGYPGTLKQEIVGELVRCRECKHYQFANERAFGMPVKRCEITGFEDVDDEDFCSRGEEETDAGIHY